MVEYGQGLLIVSDNQLEITEVFKLKTVDIKLILSNSI